MQQGHRSPCLATRGNTLVQNRSGPWETASAPRQGKSGRTIYQEHRPHVQEQLGNYDGLLNSKTMGIGLRTTTGNIDDLQGTATAENPQLSARRHVTFLLIHTSREDKQLGPEDNKKEYSARCILKRKTSPLRNCQPGPFRPRCRASGPDDNEGNSAKNSVTSKTSCAHATARNEDERGAVLLVHTGHDAANPGPGDARREHCAPDNEERERNPCPQRRIRTPRGSRRFLLFCLFLLPGWEDGTAEESLSSASASASSRLTCRSERLRTGTASSAENSWRYTCLLAFCSFSLLVLLRCKVLSQKEPKRRVVNVSIIDHMKRHQQRRKSIADKVSPRQTTLRLGILQDSWPRPQWRVPSVPVGRRCVSRASISLGSSTTGPVGCALWWRAVASSIRTVKRSCRWNARSWRCRRLMAAPGARSAMYMAIAGARQMHTKRARYPTHCSCQVFNRRALVVVVVRTHVVANVSLSI